MAEIPHSASLHSEWHRWWQKCHSDTKWGISWKMVLMEFYRNKYF